MIHSFLDTHMWLWTLDGNADRMAGEAVALIAAAAGWPHGGDPADERGELRSAFMHVLVAYLALAHIGEVDEATAVFERAVGYRNDVGLLAEEEDPGRGEFLGKTSRRRSATWGW